MTAAPVALPAERAFIILANVAQRSTRWTIVYDQTARVVHFRTNSPPREASVRRHAGTRMSRVLSDARSRFSCERRHLGPSATVYRDRQCGARHEELPLQFGDATDFSARGSGDRRASEQGKLRSAVTTIVVCQSSASRRQKRRCNKANASPQRAYCVGGRSLEGGTIPFSRM